MSSLNETPRGERVHIAFFGRRNVGKSSLVNALTGQSVSIVSDVKGTTTDPVYKSMELLPLGPVEIIDTPGLDDEGALGEMRVRRTREVLNKADIALLVADAATGLCECDRDILGLIRTKGIPFALVFNKSDLVDKASLDSHASIVPPVPVVYVSSVTGEGVHQVKTLLANMLPGDGEDRRILGDLIHPLDIVILVTPIDSAAPKGRLILPQQEALRDVLDSGAIAVTVKETELAEALKALSKKPALVVTDSQAFAKVSQIVPRNIPLTSFSILFARYKGDIAALVNGAKAIASLKDGDRVLIAEGCTHHRQKDDIGTVKIPRWLREKTGKQLVFEHSSGISYPAGLNEFALIVHCGACMLNRREVCSRIRQATEAGVPITNYGILIASLNGILPRCIEPLHLPL